MLILAVRAAELLTAQRNGLDLAARGRTWLCRVDIKAPAKPVEGNVFSLPVAATRASTEAADGGRFRSTVAVKVADMRVRVLLEHDAGGLAGSSSDLDTRFGADYPGLYGGGFRSWRQTVADVVVDVTAASSTTNVLVEPPNDPFADAGVDSAAGPVVSMVDSLVVALQLDEVEIAALFIALATLRASPSTATRTRARQPWARPARYPAPTSWRGRRPVTVVRP